MVVDKWLKQESYVQTFGHFPGSETSCFMLLTPQKAMQMEKKTWRNKIQRGRTIKIDSILLFNWVRNIFLGKNEYTYFKQLNYSNWI